MADYTSDIESARRDIEAAGIICQIDRDGATFDVPVLFGQFNPFTIDGNLILLTDIQATIPGGLERNPDNTEGDKLVIPPCDRFPNGDTIPIHRAKPLAPNGQAILWELQLRK